jgi:hypothetical protein
MRKSTRIIVLTAAMSLLAAGPAAAKHPHKHKPTAHKYAARLESDPLSTSDGYPAPGGTALLTGVLLINNPFDAGAVIDQIKVTGNPKPRVFAYKGTELDLLSDGTLRNSLKGTATVEANGSRRVVAHGRITGGTARYKGAKGHYTFSGSIAAGSTVLHGRSAGTVIY